jgi:hypothetical protein
MILKNSGGYLIGGSTIDKLKEYAGWFALLSGTIGLLWLVMLALFFAVYLSPQIAWATRGFDGFHVFGRLSDVLPIPGSIAALGMIASFYMLQYRQAHAWSVMAISLGLAAYVGVILVAMLFINEKIDLEQQTLYGSMTWGPLGIWHIVVSYLARRAGLLPSRVTIAGMFIGIAQLSHSCCFRGRRCLAPRVCPAQITFPRIQHPLFQ